ncbi:MAG: hypothetical protein M1834_008218 [Cirrosporium novae-zelandiae]|nr:MAG: hypothetical protein M1834_008218 [Cirrosporium novae-zelandiae]
MTTEKHGEPSQLRWLQPPYYVTVSIVMSIGGLLFGLDTGMIGPVTTMSSFEVSFGHLSSTFRGFVVSSILIPAAVASFFAGSLADSLGRPRAVVVGALIFGCGTALEAAAVHIAMFLMGRFITGIGEGLFLSTLVVYICEISPPRGRGPLASIPQFGTSLGICAGYFIAYGTVNITSSASWRLPLALQSSISFLCSISCIFLPQSPRWLAQAGQLAKASENWDRLGVPVAERGKDPVNVSIETIEVPTNDHSNLSARISLYFRVFKKNVRSRTILGMFLMGMQQLSGIDGVLYYAPIIFQQAGLSSDQASFLASGISALLMFLFTIPAFLLADRWGRRTSTIFGGFVLCTCMIIIGSLYASDSVYATTGPGRWVVIVAIYIFAIVYSVTWALSIRVYASEIQPPETRAAATSLAQSTNWLTGQ